MVAEPTKQLNNLIHEIDAFGANFGSLHVISARDATHELVEWLTYFRGSNTGCASELIDGIQAAVLEAIAYAGLGLARASMGAIRQEIELVLAYTYFKDHPVEWDGVRRTGDGFKLPSEVRKYHHDRSPQLAKRLQMVDRALPLTLTKLYWILSAHLHGQSPYTIPKPGELRSMVRGNDVVQSVMDMQRSVSKALSFYLVAVFAQEWNELPVSVVSDVARTLQPKFRPEFFG